MSRYLTGERVDGVRPAHVTLVIVVGVMAFAAAKGAVLVVVGVVASVAATLAVSRK